MRLLIVPNHKQFQHLYGWPWIMDAIRELDVERDVILDPYVDATFEGGTAVPYTRAWVGIIHHPFSVVQSSFLWCSAFRKSLESCQCLIVHDTVLKGQLAKYMPFIHICVLKHPGRVDWLFSLRKWFENETPLLVTSGQWLRRPGATTQCNWLQETYTDAHFERATRVMRPFIMSGVSPSEYMETMSINIMGLCFTDVSATNALIECILSCTPVIVNALPQVVEYLGPDYPLYFDYTAEACDVRVTTRNIWDAHLYLKAMDKSDLSLSVYLQGITFALTLRRPKLALPLEILDIIGGYYTNVYFTMNFCSDFVKTQRPCSYGSRHDKLGCYGWRIK